MTNPKAILIVVTQHDRIDDDHRTGLWLEEFAVPYQRFREQGYRVRAASLRGGPTPIDPQSMPDDPKVPVYHEALEVLRYTHPLAREYVASFDAVFFPGGHGAMYDLPHNDAVANVIGHFTAQGKVVAAVCHGPAALIGAVLADGTPVIKGHRLTTFTNAEEAEVGMDARMPFLLESKLRELGAEVVTSPNWNDHVIVDGSLVTGQNPQSSRSATEAVIRLLGD